MSYALTVVVFLAVNSILDVWLGVSTDRHVAWKVVGTAGIIGIVVSVWADLRGRGRCS